MNCSIKFQQMHNNDDIMVGLFSRKNQVKNDNDDINEIEVLYDKFEHQMQFLKKKMENNNNEFGKFNGIVIQGNKKMNKISFPTANIECGKINLKSGLYTSNIEIDGIKYNGISIIHENKDLIEMNIFDFNENIYGKKVSISILKYLSDFTPKINEDYYKSLKEKLKLDYPIAQKYFQSK